MTTKTSYLQHPSLVRRKSSVEGYEMIEALTSAMYTFPYEERVQISCLKVMRHIIVGASSSLQQQQPQRCDNHHTNKEETKSSCVEDDGDSHNKPNLHDLLLDTMVETIIQAMQAYPRSVELQVLAVSILTCMCSDDHAAASWDSRRLCHAIVEGGGLIRLSETMTFHRRLPVAQRARHLHDELSQYLLLRQDLKQLDDSVLMSSSSSSSSSSTPHSLTSPGGSKDSLDNTILTSTTALLLPWETKEEDEDEDDDDNRW